MLIHPHVNAHTENPIDDIGGHICLGCLHNLDVAELLGRSPVKTTLNLVGPLIRGRSVLITGAGGTIGAELARQVSAYAPARVCFLDRDESALHATELSIAHSGLLTSEPYVLCDIRDREALADIFTRYRPDIVFHAAALKHVPMLERFPEEGWKTNVVGTAHVLGEALRMGVTTFVNISTDKAADPSTVLGQTKRLGEMLTAHAAEEGTGRYVSVRFGNVLGSRGSVLETFAYQIAHRLPVTVTDPEVTRFFMTINEACRLVLEAATIGHDGHALVLEMGEAVRIADIATRLIDRAGSSSPIVYTGLRPGEKMREVLFSQAENPRPTQHPAIRAVAVPPIDPRDIAPSYAHMPMMKERTSCAHM
ncbi:polysaccharide biosynthesis protein [Nanchangia anserum]|uniref:polysaccharide biosynthesis protein n=1 Tax=Nanchangia anserum TaxID=2692125 RepID=UPI001D113217|nr:polysaccharide biosynthesis protein [Nanchangia anserum]